MRLLIGLLVLLLLALQFPLWPGKGGLLELRELRREVATQQAENERLRERNLALEAEVIDLKEGLEAVEERARSEMGMIRKGEVFYQVIPPPGSNHE